MKKFFVTIVSLLVFVGAAFAQDMSGATELAQQANEALSSGNQEAALAGFKEALTQAEACGEEGAELVATCKGIIPKIILSQAKKAVTDSDFDSAIGKINEAKTLATEYGVADAVEDATDLLPKVLMQKGNSLLNSKNFAEAVKAYSELVAADPENGQAYLRLGLAQSSVGNAAEAEKAFNTAAQYGQADAANKQLSTLHLKKASAALSAKNYASALSEAEKAFSFNENPTAYKIAGVAATKIVDKTGKLTKKAEAIKYLEKYIELSPNAKDAAAMKQNIEAIKKL